MAELEQALRELRVEWPPTPDIAAAVRARIATEPAPAGRRRRFAIPRPALAYAAALLLVAVGVTLAASPSARSALLEFFGLKGARIERRDVPPAVPSPPARRDPLGASLDLGRPTTLAQARRLARFDARPPAALGAPDAIYFDADGGRVSFVYAPRPGLPESQETGVGLLVSEYVAEVAPFIEKSAGPGTEIERISVDGYPGFYLSGDPHGFAYGTPGEDVRFEPQRLAGPTLLLERDGVLVRIEGRVSKRRAIEIAESTTATSARPAG